MIHAAEQPYQVLVVDDEPAARRGVAQLLDDYGDFRIVGECATGEELVAAVRHEQPDLVFLDVRMPGLDGFEALARLGPEATPLVIFVTGYDRYAVRAFEAHAIDYILKPYSMERFRRALEHARDQLRRRRLDDGSPYPARLLSLLHDLSERGSAPGSDAAADGEPFRFLVRKSQGRVVIVPCDSVLWIEAQRDYVALHTADGDHLVRDTMGNVERRLDDRFVRIHRSTIVRLDTVVEIRTTGDRLEVLLRDGTRHPVSARGRSRLRKRLGSKL